MFHTLNNPNGSKRRRPDHFGKIDDKRRTSAFPRELEDIFPPGTEIGFDIMYEGENVDAMCDGVFIFPLKKEEAE